MTVPTLLPTARHAMEAYGGAERWLESKAVEVCFSARGWAFRLKWQKPYVRARARFAL
jgi:hypothetical protein